MFIGILKCYMVFWGVLSVFWVGFECIKCFECVGAVFWVCLAVCVGVGGNEMEAEGNEMIMVMMVVWRGE